MLAALTRCGRFIPMRISPRRLNSTILDRWQRVLCLVLLLASLGNAKGAPVLSPEPTTKGANTAPLSEKQLEKARLKVYQKLKTALIPKLDIQNEPVILVLDFYNRTMRDDVGQGITLTLHPSVKEKAKAKAKDLITFQGEGSSLLDFLLHLNSSTSLQAGFIGKDIYFVSDDNPPDGFVALDDIQEQKSPPKQDPAWPTTVDEAVTILLNELSDENKETIRKMDDPIRMHMSLGMQVRNRFGLWKGNQPLLIDTGQSHPDEASSVILTKLWKILRGEEQTPTTKKETKTN